MGYTPPTQPRLICNVQPISYSEPTPTTACQSELDVALGLCAAFPQRELVYCKRCYSFKSYKPHAAIWHGRAGECQYRSNVEFARNAISATKIVRYKESPEWLNQHNDCENFQDFTTMPCETTSHAPFPWAAFFGAATAIAFALTMTAVLMYLLLIRRG